ncbi:D-lactate dehydrogenase [Saprolegnia diclina VS20]|uniref:D-lactate dehydrogenase n=1 Tax=Saprolegnia diclina (strain VS20) TaxID=1156394 RepID=T0S3T1_SAPDV|nr:D-lactate dehydrogenase [Saprolegnia diclina VS20]EQC39718.1 D-lactate dehydrogenase [Saprolegnia diclina VS20]|eukprot:XP_008606990.1 D-lactate dehydrogenase [Saprolegnia diclina VS20]
MLRGLVKPLLRTPTVRRLSTTAADPMKIAFFSAHSYDTESMQAMAKKEGIHGDLRFFPHRLNISTAPLASECDIAVAFVNDTVDAPVLRKFKDIGVKAVLLRSAGFDMVDLAAAKNLDMPILNVPSYSPYAVAEHAAGLMMTLNRKYHRAYNRTRDFNFNLQGLLGFDLHGKTVGVIGTGKIGALFAKIATGFGCNVLAYDVAPNPEALSYGVKYASLDEVLAASDIISLHCPLFPSTHHVINDSAISKMKKGVMLINTSRGGLMDTEAIIRGLTSDIIGSVALDVIEGENGIFYEDHSGEILADENFAKLFTFPNVLITGHQAYFTREALDNIAKTTMDNIKAVAAGGPYANQVNKRT